VGVGHTREAVGTQNLFSHQSTDKAMPVYARKIASAHQCENLAKDPKIELELHGIA